jgi:hypothetical protein
MSELSNSNVCRQIAPSELAANAELEEAMQGGLKLFISILGGTAAWKDYESNSAESVRARRKRQLHE